MKKLVSLFTVILSLTCALNLQAQEGSIVTGTVTDTLGMPLANVVVTAGSKTTKTNMNGTFSIRTSPTDIIVLELEGYEPVSIEPTDLSEASIQLREADPGFAENAKLPLPFRETLRNNFVGAASVITDEDLNVDLDINLTSTLKGKASGLYITERPGAHGNSDYGIAIRGLNSTSLGNSTPLIIVDGVERPLGFVQASDVESITVLKDALAKSFLKGKAANGVILIKTKRGEKNKNFRSINLQGGISFPDNLPQPLASAEYATLYNQARRNDGLPDIYTQNDLQGYLNPNVRYPSNNYHDLLLNDSREFIKLSTIFNGGGENIRYNVNGNFVRSGGLEAIGSPNDLNQFSLRSNLDFTISPAIEAFIDVYGFLDNNHTNYLQENDLFSRMSTQRPNEYAIFLNTTDPAQEDHYGAGRLGVSSAYQNLYAEMLLGGTRENTQRLVQANVGLNFNLESILEGLSARTFVAFDSYNFVSVGKNDNFFSYLPEYDQSNVEINRSIVTVGVKNSDLRTLGSDGYRQYTVTGQLDYQKVFGDSKIDMSLVIFADQMEPTDEIFDNRSQSNTLLTNYSFRDKYIAQLNLGLLGSSKLPKGNQYGFFPAVGLGWVLSRENFLAGNENIDFLKLKTSFGLSGSDRALNYFSYRTRYNYYNSELTYFGNEAENGIRTATLSTFANPAIDWEKSREFNVGIEGVFRKNFSFNLNYYHIDRTNIPIFEDIISNQLSGIAGKQINFAAIENNGVDAMLSYNKNVGNWNFRGSVNGNLSKSVYRNSSSAENFPSSRNLDGKDVDAHIGLVSQGLITNANELSTVNQGFGNVRLGDLQYEDINGDGFVDQNDSKAIGNFFPRLQYGTTLSVGYKNLGLKISGYGAAFYDIYLNNSYYRPTAETSYYASARESFNVETGEGKFPALSVSSSSNNYRLSDFWLVDGGYFKLKEAELSYSLPNRLTDSMNVNNLRLSVKGNNLMTFTDVENVDPEYINAGFTSYPFMRTVALGINVTF